MKNIIVLLFNDFTHDNRVMKECRSLVGFGYDVTLVATHFDTQLPKAKSCYGFDILRTNVGTIRFLPINLLLFWFNIIYRYRHNNVFHCNDLYTLPVGYIIKRIFNKKAKIIYDCHEYETEADIYNNKPKFYKILASFVERLMINTADEIITVSDSIANEYKTRYKIKKPHLIFNSPPIIKIKKNNYFRRKYKIPNNKVIFLFQGQYMPDRGVEELIELFKRIENSNRILVLVFLMYGENIEKIKNMVHGCRNIYLHKKVRVTEYMKYVSSADWGIYLMRNTCKNNDYALPNKIFDYIGGGLPIITSDLFEMKKFISKQKIGYTVDTDKPNELINLLNKISPSTKRRFTVNIQKTAQEYCWEQQEKKLQKIYQSL